MSSETAITNGDLPAVREAIVEQGLRISQETAAERDALRLRVADLMTEIAGLKAQLEIAELTASQLQSKMDSTMAIRDEAVVRRAEVETVLSAMMALGRAFQIQNEPLIKEVEDDENVPPPARVNSDIG